MSNKAVDVDLRIRAKNLAGKTLSEINGLVESLAENQRKQASSADLAARSTKDLAAEQNALLQATRELQKREGLTRTFIEQQAEIKKQAALVTELTAKYREMSKGIGAGTTVKDLQNVGREILEANDALNKMVAGNAKAGAALKKIGVDADKAEAELADLSSSVRTAETAYQGSVDAINGHATAVRLAGEAAQEAARREAAAAKEVERARAAFGATAGRAGELGALRADIEQRSAQARAIDISAEAARRLATAEAEEASSRTRANSSIREAVSEYDRLRQKRADATAAFSAGLVQDEREARVQAEAEARRRRIIALIQSERGQRVLAAEATRNETRAVDQNTGAHTRNDTAVRRGAGGIGLFNDVGRKSLGTYQRLRGQLLGLAAAYIGVYQAINTFSKAIDATNRNQSLRIGLTAVNNGDARAAAEDYKFLREEAERLGLVFDDVAPQFANLAIAGKAVGLTGQQIRSIFTDVSTAAAAMNLSVEDTEGVFRAMVQIFSKGKVQAEELRGQLGDRLPGAVVKFAAANNIALGDLDKKLKDGAVGIGFVINGIQEYAKQYDSTMDDVTGRLQAHINRAKNAYNDFLRVLLAGDAENKLKEAFGRITEFLNSDDGAVFAKKLANAFGALIDVFLWLADNIDLVTAALKLFIGVQVAKFLTDTVLGVTSAIGAFRNLVTWVKATRAAYIAGNTATVTLTASTRLLGLAFGPVGIAIAAITGLVYGYITSIEKATQRTKDYTDALYDVTFARTADDLSKGMGKVREEADKLKAEIADLYAVKDAESGGPGGLLDAAGAFARVVSRGQTKLTESGYMDSIIEKTRRLDNLTQTLSESELKLAQLRDKEETASRQPAGTPLPALITPDKDPKDTSKKEMAEANARANAARAIQKQLLDLDQELFDARTDGNVKTQAQIDKNYQLAIDKIASETEERLLAIDKLEQASRTANKGAVPEEEARSLQLARDRVLELKTALNVRAMEMGDLQSINVQEQKINDLIDARNAKVAYLNTLKQTGAISDADAYVQTIAAQNTYNEQIRTLINELLPQLQAIDPTSNLYTKLGVPQLIAGLQQAVAEMNKLTDAQRVGLSIGKQFASGFSSALVNMGKAIADAADGTQSWGDAFKNTMDAFRNFAADFLQQIAQMILEAIIFQAIQNAIKGTSGGYWQAVVGAFTQHTGGIAGSQGLSRRNVNPAVFAGAQRFHEGGLPGLKPNEVATILEKGEEVVTEDNPRHIANAGGMQPQVNIDMITTLDSGDVLSQGLRSGRKQVVNDLTSLMRANKNQIKTALGL